MGRRNILIITPDNVEAAYNYLKLTDPFIGMRLPESDELGFKIIKDPKTFADFSVDDGVRIIRVNDQLHGHTATLMATVAHEMIHVYQDIIGDRGHHNALFKRVAKRVCQIHGFDPKTF